MASVLARGRQRLSTRPFAVTLLIISILTAYSFLAHTYQPPLAGVQISDPATHLVARSKHSEPECRDVRFVKNQCKFVKKYCKDADAGLISYLDLYYCKLGHVQPVAFILIVLWLGMLFTTIGIAASDFFSVNLSTIATILRLSESFAGVTFLALGNGSPDVFSTLAAMASNSASMAVGELIGAACFISGVVAGSMALVREFKVDRRSYVRDICFLIVAVVFTMIFLADGSLHFWECWAMIAFYFVYVATVVGWHWYFSRRKLRLRREGEARSHFYGSTSQDRDELAGEPYRDDPDDVDRTHGAPETPSADISALEAGPRIELDGQDWEQAVDEQAQDHERMVAAEVSRSMRVLRTGRNRRNTNTPIRPSLVGALEFRSALAQLQRESNWQLSNMPSRSHSVNHIPQHRRRGASYVDSSSGSRSQPDPRRALSGHGRGRAFSTSTAPGVITETEDLLSDGEQEGEQAEGATKASMPSPSYTVGGNLAPPPTNASSAATSATVKGQLSQKRPLLSVQTATTPGSNDGSAPTSPFPQFTDSPMLMTPAPNAEPSEFMLPAPVVGRRIEVGSSLNNCDCVVEPKPVSWWPYSALPPPHIILATLFPTLQGWRGKTWWDRFVSTISVPSIFLLVLTLPVVEPGSDEDDQTNITIASQPGHVGNTACDVDRLAEINARRQSSTEWERYRDRNTQNNSHSSSCRQSPQLLALTNEDTLVEPSGGSGTSPPTVTNKALSDFPSGDDSAGDPGTWNRWLVCLQLFTGPLFAVFILWANMKDDWENPKRILVKMVLYSMLTSLVLLAILIFITVEHIRPKHHYVLCFLGFVISIAWISTIAGEVVGVLQTLGVVLDISEALLGLTIFAAGNSVGDLVADITVARLGHPVMALSACFGGPLLNILLGIGIGGVLMMVQGANHEKRKHPDKPIKYGPYPVEIGGTLLVSSVTLLIILSGLLIAVPLNKWVLSRKIGWALIAVWSVSTAVNVAMEFRDPLQLFLAPSGPWQHAPGRPPISGRFFFPCTPPGSTDPKLPLQKGGRPVVVNPSSLELSKRVASILAFLFFSHISCHGDGDRLYKHTLPPTTEPNAYKMAAAATFPPLEERPLKDTICLFDVDGTLTPARLGASPEILAILRALRQKCAIGFVGGSDLVKQEEQIGGPAGAPVTTLFDFCFSENGLTAFKLGQALPSNSFIQWIGEKQYQELANFVLHYIADLDIPVKRGTFIEFRNGMINISPVGRNASNKERNEFEAYDKDAKVREKFVSVLKEKFGHLGLTFSIGGQISFDVFPTGWDKTYCLKHLEDEAKKPNGIAYKNIHFFGDKTAVGGNDYEIYEDPRTIGHSVKGPEDTMAILKEVFGL